MVIASLSATMLDSPASHDQLLDVKPAPTADEVREKARTSLDMDADDEGDDPYTYYE